MFQHRAKIRSKVTNKFKMEKGKRERRSAKPKNRFTLCCFCVGSSNSDAELNVPFEKHEAYDYVVEKLAIKRVPISLFATDEDLAEMQNEVMPTASNKTLDVPISPRDKRSATVFSSYYTMIQKNNAYPSVLKSKLKRPDIKPVPGNIEVKPNVQPKMETKFVPKPAVKFKREPEEIIKEITRAEVHKEQNEIFKDARMTPKLQETINELGSKKRPTGSAGINHRTVKRIPHHEANNQKEENFNEKRIRDLLLQHIMNPDDIIKAEIEKASTLQLPVVINDSTALPLLETKQIKSNNELMPLVNSKPDEPPEQEKPPEPEKPKSKKVELTSSINLNDFIMNAGASKSVTSQKWKIIIKEHDKAESTSPFTMANTPNEVTDDEESEEEETETEQEAD